MTITKQRAHERLKLSALILLGAWLMTAVACSQRDEFHVQHDISDGPMPWTNRPVNFNPDTVRFAVFSDLTGGEREGIFDVAVEQMNLLQPELIVNVGDLIEGSSDASILQHQWDSFDARARNASARVFYTGGNHDLLGEEMRRTWEDRLGPRFYHFRYRNLLFLVLDTEDHSADRLRNIALMRSEALSVAQEQGWEAYARTEYANLAEDETGMISQAQSNQMLQALSDHQDVRWTFLLMHKSPWANEDMPTWLAIEEALRERPHTVFHGHRHAYRHQQRNGHDYIRLATTGGVFLPQNGRNMDQVVWVTVDGDGAHIANLKMSGILDKTGNLPLDGENRCMQPEDCPIR
jgi:predicted phosphodiesterase